MKIGTFIIDDIANDIYLENGIYYECIDNEKKEINKLDIAERVAMVWSSTYDTTEKYNDEYISTKQIPIYDWITLLLYGYGKNKEESLDNVNKIYNDFISFYDIFEKNEERNKNIFMKNIHKFAYFNNEIHFFEDNIKDFRALVIDCGIPNDARADEPIFGYVENNELVIFKWYFFKKEKEFFTNFWKENHKKIAQYYNLKNYKLYIGINEINDFGLDKNKCIDEKYMYCDYKYYQPKEFIGNFET